MQRKKRITKKEYLELKESIDIAEFKFFYKNNCNDNVCEKYNITIHVMYKLLNDLHIVLTDSEKRARNKIASNQKVNKKYNITTGNIYSDPQLKKYFTDKIKETCLTKYGKDNYFKTEEFKEKSKEACLLKYGTEYASQSNQIKEKVKNNNLLKYGVTNPSKLESSKEKQHESIIKRFGSFDNYIKYIQSKIRQTCLDRYGVEYASQSTIIQDKTKQTCLKKYNVPYFCMTEKCRKYSGNNSNVNKNFFNLFKIFFNDIQKEFRLENYSYDFKINRYLIEIDPSIIHNSTFSVFKNVKPKDKYYHQNKSKVAQKYGYRCIHIFD